MNFHIHITKSIRLVFFLTSLLIFSLSITANAYQYVKVEGRSLVADFDMDGQYAPFFIKGVGYSPMPIGRHPSDWGWQNANDPRPNNTLDDPAILERDFTLLEAMHANTIRIWKGNDTEKNGRFPIKITSNTLDHAENHQIKIMAGFWIDTPSGWWECTEEGSIFHVIMDFTNASLREDIKSRFADYVTQLKNHPAILLWAIANENNLSFGDNFDQINAFYSLVNEMAELAHQIEGTDFHPVVLVNGDIKNLGDSNQGTTDADMPHLDVWAANVYKGDSFGDLFDEFKTKSTKPLLISEFGTDAWHTNDVDNPSDGFEDQTTQAVWAGKLWDEIAANNDATIGGTVMEYSDEWWKPNEWLCADDNDPNTTADLCNAAQTYYGFGPKDNSCPVNGTFDDPEDNLPIPLDQFNNEEWWGIMAIAKNPDNAFGPDIMIPRQIYTTLQEKFRPQNLPPILDPINDKELALGDLLQFTVTAHDPESASIILTATLGSGDTLDTIGASFTDAGDGTGSFTWTTRFTNIGNIIPIKFTATDEGGATDVENIFITLNVVQNPNEQTPWQNNENGTLIEDQSLNYTLGYHFTPQKNGVINTLGGYFNGTKKVSLWNKTTGELLAQVQVPSSNTWNYSGITPVNVQAGEEYTVAAYLAGSGASFRQNVQTLPQTYADITIQSACFKRGDIRPINEEKNLMYGQVDIGFIPDGSVANQPPIIHTGPTPEQTTLNSGENTTISVIAEDLDGDPLTYTWTASQGTIAGNSLEVTYTAPTIATETTVTINVEISDGKGGTITGTVDITILPIIGGKPEQMPWQNNENGTLTINQNFNYTLGYHFIPQTNGTINKVGGYFNGTKIISLWKRSTGELLTQTQVSSNNTWNYVSIPPVNVQDGEEYTVAAYLAGSGASYRENIQTLPQTYGAITIQSACYRLGDQRPSNDEKNFMYGQVDIGFIPEGSIVNQAPVIQSGPTAANSSLNSGQSTAISLSAIDPDNDPLTYIWTATQGNIIGNGFEVTYTAPTVDTETTITIQVTVSDEKGGNVSGTVNLTIRGGAGVQTPWQSHENGTLITGQKYDYTLGYHFTPNKNGTIHKLGGYFWGTKTVFLWNRATGELLGETPVTSTLAWSYADVTPVDVQAGVEYTVAAYLAGHDASYRKDIQALPQTYDDITIQSACYKRGQSRPINDEKKFMYGQADIIFIPN